MTATVSREEMNRLFWNSRRGMLELDVLLVPFSQEVFPTLKPELQADYVELLKCEDSDLFSWFMNREQPQDERLAAMVQMVVQRARESTPIH